jgi:hypothetical protein
LRSQSWEIFSGIVKDFGFLSSSRVTILVLELSLPEYGLPAVALADQANNLIHLYQLEKNQLRM